MPSVEWAIMRDPAHAYQHLLAGRERTLSPLAALRRVVVVLLLVGATMATTATFVADAAVVARTAAAWSFVALVQVVGAVALIASRPARHVPAPRAFDLLFAANGPWSLWLVGVTLWTATGNAKGRSMHDALPTLVLPALWTAYLVFRYCEVVLGDSRRRALWATGLHQGAMWLVFSGTFFWAVQGWPRLLAGWPWRQ